LEIRILSPTAILGYGYPLESLERGLAMEPDVIAVDAGSTDPGPYYLGEGTSFVSAEAVKRDLYYLVKAVKEKEIPLLIGSAGGAGASPHLEWTLRILEEIQDKLGIKLKVGLIRSDIDKELLARKISEGLYNKPLHPSLDKLSRDTIQESTRIVAQVGVEPFIHLLEDGADIILGGRSVDVAPFAALPWMQGFEKGLSIHLGKILECGAIAAEPGSGSDGMMGILRTGEFEVFPLNPSRKATLTSIAEHAMYERTDPLREHVPGGYADMSNAVYEEAGDGRVVVRGSKWVEADQRLVKLEGVKLTGYRVIVIAGARDPGFLARLNELIDRTLDYVERLLGEGGYAVYPRVYGRNGVMGQREPLPQTPHEVGLVFEVISSNASKARTVAGLIRSTLLHIGWEDRKTTAGNLAFPFSPSDIPAGRVYEWSIYHLVEESSPLEFSQTAVLEGGK